MKTFKEFLDESSLSRIKSKSDKKGIAVMSASRSKLSANCLLYTSDAADE